MLELKEKTLLLREQTGMGLLDCKKSLEEANGDMERAKVLLAKRWETVRQTSLISYRKN